MDPVALPRGDLCGEEVIAFRCREVWEDLGALPRGEVWGGS